MVQNIFTTNDGALADESIPNAVFASRALCDEFAPEQRLYEAAVAAYEVEIKPTTIRTAVRAARALGYTFVTQRVVRESAEAGIRMALLELPGYTEQDVQWHIANPGKRQASGFYNERSTGGRGRADDVGRCSASNVSTGSGDSRNAQASNSPREASRL